MPSPKTGNSVVLFQNKGIAVQLCLIEIERWSAMIDVQRLISNVNRVLFLTKTIRLVKNIFDGSRENFFWPANKCVEQTTSTPPIKPT
jgi:hypothetical protein